ncbi:LLM class flavin-dependent oxidoreductase [Mycolicibacterium setense]|uniref:LLM class flavin-dependent oxidoreductase n=1 Tax=Mycolicibacterium setense TaxID=431269 RepID=UPI0009E310D0|nr:LLM class flavin-dependent oxidoreductase [Mycolicibacterium setense]MCV7113660.1 LLM class flavin-dependent oxidoreductase [Mycolicibacterium setense]
MTADEATFGVLLNFGASQGDSVEQVFDFGAVQAHTAEQLGFDDLWVTEHHFIRFGINPSALTAAAFLLGRTRHVRVGTSVVLSPLSHPVELAERAALLDQLSHGRFELGLGRGGYRRDFEVLGVDFARWDEEPCASAQRILELWRSGEQNPGTGESLTLQPPVRTKPHPNLLMATASAAGIAFAAQCGLPLQHYFATPAEQRMQLQDRYRELSDGTAAAPKHLHTLIVIVDSADGRREQLAGALKCSFRDGDHPHVPQAMNRHHGPDGQPGSPAEMADIVAGNAIIGGPAQVVDELGRFIQTTGAQRIAVYPEAIGDHKLAIATLEALAADVLPQLRRQ